MNKNLRDKIFSHLKTLKQGETTTYKQGEMFLGRKLITFIILAQLIYQELVKISVSNLHKDFYNAY